MARESTNTRWWGLFTLGVGERGFWHVGPATLAVSHRAGEWSVERAAREDVTTEEAFHEFPSEAEVEGTEIVTTRFSVDVDDSSLHLTPALADRSVVVYPEHAFYVPANQHITLFCSSPLWLRVQVGDEKLLLEEFPLFRPRDTWFGPSTREGELCYASKTAARLRREDLIPRPHRAFTELSIHNEAATTLHLERVNLSVPYLSLYRGGDDCFWTNRLSLKRTGEGALSELHIEAEPAAGLDAVLVAEPRIARARNVMVRAFSALFSGG